MFLRKWGMLGAVLGAAVFAGCDESATEQVQEKQEDVIEAQQNLREKKAELNEVERDAQTEAIQDGHGPATHETTIPSPAVPPVERTPASETAESTGGPTLAPLPGPGDDAATEPLPNEGNPEPDAANASGSDAGSAENADTPETADEETPAEAPEPSTPQ